MHTQSRLRRPPAAAAPAVAVAVVASQPPALATLRGVGPVLADRLARLGVHSLADLLFVLPLRYEDRTRIVPIGALVAGSHALVEGEVLLAEVVFRRRRQLLLRLGDGSGSLTLRFFHFSNAQREGLARGTRLRCHGEVRRGPLGLEIVHPEYRSIGAAGAPLPQTLTPIYPATEGLTQGRLRALVQRAFIATGDAALVDYLPADLCRELQLPGLRAALDFLHQPPVGTALTTLAAGRHPAQRRLALEELLAHQLSLMALRRATKANDAPPLSDRAGLQSRLLAGLPFRFTAAQTRVLGEINADLALAQPMTRLVQGDVGCGKTAVAAAAAAFALGAGHQVALMAPTELLAEQHARTLTGWFTPLEIPVALVTGSQPARARRTALAAIAAGQVPLVVGTHALFQESMKFASLALAIIDEQHRFGVQQRLQLRQKSQGRLPHQLIMTATPIPRTLAMTAYADLDISVIDELPPGRKPVRTVVVPEERRAEIVARIDGTCRNGGQAYWVCALIEESEELRCQAAEESAALLSEALPQLRVGLVHGRLSAARKEAVMHAFNAGEIQLLVATTVIEVGVDVPNASVMVIDNAERMGLAQLHQLRGRVGRGAQTSSCVLLYRAPLSEMARERLAALRQTNDGFEIARRDLELRGPGELLGTRQTGLAQLRVADLIRDADLLPQVRRLAARLEQDEPRASEGLIARWVGAGEQYGRVG
ncbi:MAG TPA: ATP-dependent DNA helicase RecG [Steroidobacteraceae bacterium]|nr:ATP-dependent DNA helicase RecG [Steroidobacteraceae bacterium]